MSEQDRAAEQSASTAHPQVARQARDVGQPAAKGFLGSLFDASFTTFVTPKLIRVLYLLIIIAVLLTALGYVILAFRASAALGVLVLVVGAPLFTIICLAIWRIILEAFMVIFRIADDIRTIRNS